MILTLDTERLRTLDDLHAFSEGNDPVTFHPESRDDVCAFVRSTSVRFQYSLLNQRGKGLVKGFLGKVTNLPRAQLTRLIGQYVRTGAIRGRREGIPRRQRLRADQPPSGGPAGEAAHR